jgi:putative ABC transport system ATP-binding protein
MQDGAPFPTAGPAEADLGAPEEEPPAIWARDVFKIYRQGRAEVVALRGASLSVRAGEYASLMGPSGSGKSTFLSILAALARPSAGAVMIDGQDLADFDDGALAGWRAHRIGIVFQHGNLLPFLTAEENVTLIARRRWGRRRARREARDLLAQLGLAERRSHRPAQLSGGEAQRAAIAVALVNEPRVLYGDELTGELDSATSEQVMEILLELQQDRGLTLLLVTHDPATAASADRRFRVSDGLVSER